jgi:hypothetical protein
MLSELPYSLEIKRVSSTGTSQESQDSFEEPPVHAVARIIFRITSRA